MTFSTKKIAYAVTASILGAALSANASAQGDVQALTVQNSGVSSLAQTDDQLPKRYIVKYKKSAGNTVLKSFGRKAFKDQAMSQARDGLQRRGGKIKLQMKNHHAFSAELSARAVAELRMDPSVEYVEEDVPRKLMSLYNDDVGNPAQTQLTPYAIYQSQANQLALQSGQKVCVIDSGIAGSTGETGGLNNDFDWNSITGTSDSGTGDWFADGGPHGTHVAGTIAAKDNGFGVIGMAPGVPLHIIKVFNDAGWAYSSDLAEAASHCADAGANIITMSLGGGAANTTEENAFKEFTNNGGLVLAAAGNDGNNVRSYPAGYDSVMMIGANDADNGIADFSQYPACNSAKTNCVEVTAGGVNTLSTYPSGGATLPTLTVDGMSYQSSALENTGSVSGTTFYMGTAESTNAGANGKVCVIDRGNISFHDKVLNCQNSGGIGAIIINNVAGVLAGTLGDTNATSIPAVGAAFEDKTALVNSSSATVAVAPGDYGYMSGTSMATPAVAGVAALVWSNHSSCTGTNIRNALKATAADAGAAGHDVYFGNGVVKAKLASDYLTAYGCAGDTGGGTDPVGNALANGVAKTSLAATKGGNVMFTLEVPAGATNLNFVTAGGSGDADMYVRFGAAPTTSTYDCRPYKSGNAETCTISNVQAGTYHVMLNAYATFSGVSLTGSYTEPSTGGGTGGAGSASETNLSGARRAWAHYTVEIPAGMSSLKVDMAGGTGDADLYVRKGSKPTSSAYDCRPYKSGNTESCNLSSPAAGTWYISIYGYSAYTGVGLNIEWN